MYIYICIYIYIYTHIIVMCTSVYTAQHMACRTPRATLRKCKRLSSTTYMYVYDALHDYMSFVVFVTCPTMS